MGNEEKTKRHVKAEKPELRRPASQQPCFVSSSAKIPAPALRPQWISVWEPSLGWIGFASTLPLPWVPSERGGCRSGGKPHTMNRTDKKQDSVRKGRSDAGEAEGTTSHRPRISEASKKRNDPAPCGPSAQRDGGAGGACSQRERNSAIAINVASQVRRVLPQVIALDPDLIEYLRESRGTPLPLFAISHFARSPEGGQPSHSPTEPALPAPDLEPSRSFRCRVEARSLPSRPRTFYEPQPSAPCPRQIPRRRRPGRVRIHSEPSPRSFYNLVRGMVNTKGALAVKPEEAKEVVAVNGKLVDIQDKEVTMEGICSITAYDQWTPLSVCGQLPKPRYKHGAAVVQEKMYVFGGNHNGRYLGDIQVLDLKNLSWSKLEANIQPGSSESAETVSVAPCAGHSLIPSGNKIMLLAGHTRKPTESLTVKEFDPQTCTWSTLRTYGRSPSSRGGQSVTPVGGTLVVFGGEGDGRCLLNDLHVLDLETMTWDEFESTGTPPSPRSDHAAACYADRYLLIFGGGSHSTCFSDLYLLDMETMEWSRPEQHGITPEPRAGHEGVTVGDNWFITGGGNSKKGVSETLVLNMSTFVWSVVTTFEGRAPPTSEGSSLVLHTVTGEDFLLSFGGYSGRYSNEVYALKPSVRSSVQSHLINKTETNGITPISVTGNSNRGPIFEIEELQAEKNRKGGDINKVLLQAVKDEKNQVEERLEHEKLRSFHLKKELADVENRNVDLTKELHSIRDQLSDEESRASKLENEVSEIQQRLQRMADLEKEFESLRREQDVGKSASDSNKKAGGPGFRRWYGSSEG